MKPKVASVHHHTRDRFSRLLIVYILLGCGFTMRSATVNFDYYQSPTDNDYVNNFNNATGGYIAVPTGGITGGALQLTGSLAYPVYRTAFDLSSGLAESLFMKYDNVFTFNGNGSQLQLGLCGSPTGAVGSILDPTDYFWTEVYNDGNLRFWSRAIQNTLGNGSIGVVSFTAPQFGDWLKLNFNVRYLGANQFQLSASVQDYGPSGTAPAVDLASSSVTLTDAAAAADASVYPGFSGGWYHVSYYDNFTVEPVPEPTSLGQLACGGLLAFCAKRLSRRKG